MIVVSGARIMMTARPDRDRPSVICAGPSTVIDSFDLMLRINVVTLSDILLSSISFRYKTLGNVPSKLIEITTKVDVVRSVVDREQAIDSIS